MRKEIGQIEADIERIEAECLAKGLDITASNSGTEYGSEKESIRLQSSHREGKFEAKGIQTNQSPTGESSYNNKGDRINRWILHKLRTSPLEIELFVRVFLELVHLISIQQWEMGVVQFQQQVLLLWGEDKANKPSAAFKALPTRTLSDPRDSILAPRERSQEHSMDSANVRRAGDSEKG